MVCSITIWHMLPTSASTPPALCALSTAAAATAAAADIDVFLIFCPPAFTTLVHLALPLQNGLRDAVLDDFKMLLGSSDVKLTPDNIERLANACLVVNALGPKVRGCGVAGHLTKLA